ncbi:MAG: hypothetical protein HXY45_12155 [Syntrophaceae bacterium]|nr:hypothetical protein [Syntrophaceae bacterium]
MRGLSAALVILLTFFFPLAALADYILQLKNGRTVETARFWEEKEEIKFQWPGGVVSLPKKDLLSITEVERKSPGRFADGEEHTLTRKPENAPAAPRAALNPTGKVPPAEGSSFPDGLREGSAEYYQRQKAYYLEQFERAYRRYLEASSRRDREGKKKAWEEFNRFGGQVITLEAELKKKNHGILPSWWNDSIPRF